MPLTEHFVECIPRVVPQVDADGNPVVKHNYRIATDAEGNHVLDADGNPVTTDDPESLHTDQLCTVTVREMSPEDEAAHLASQADSQALAEQQRVIDQQRADALAALVEHATANPTDPTAMLAKALGLV